MIINSDGVLDGRRKKGLQYVCDRYNSMYGREMSVEQCLSMCLDMGIDELLKRTKYFEEVEKDYVSKGY